MELALPMTDLRQACDSTPESQVTLMDQLARGDSAKLEVLIDLYAGRLNQLIGRLTAWGPDQEDILQDVFVTAWERASTYRGEGSLEGWLRQIAVNRCRKQHRAKKMLTAMLDRLRQTHTVVTEPAPLSAESTEDLIQQALHKLKPDERIAIVLYYLEELSGEEVAELLKIRTQTLHVRLHRARTRLRVLLEEEQTDD